MKIIGLLAWYDESPSWLASCVTSLAPHIDHLVAVDGAYAHFPDARARSERIQAETIQATAEAAQLACTIHRPATYWHGGEVEKRSTMFRIAQAYREGSQDWYWVIDADCVVTGVPGDFRARLAETEANAVEVVLWERRDYLGDVPDVARTAPLPTASEQKLRMLFRALKDVQVVGAHFVYGGFDDAGEWHYLWGHGAMPVDEAEYFRDVRVEHRSIWRDVYRRDMAKAYYKTRDALGIERVLPRGDNGTSGQVEVTRS